MSRLEVLSVIPARGGSKGLPRKNVLDLGGKPLIAWTIEAARACPAVTRVVVSTDDPEIAEAAAAHGAEVPFVRPAGLAGDASLLDDVFAHALDALKAHGYRPDVLVAMYPTSPFRPSGMLETMIARVSGGFRSALTVRPVTPGRAGFLRLDASGRLRPDLPADKACPATRTSFRAYGLAHAYNLTERFAAHGTYLHKITDPAHLLDIDTPRDLEMARAVVRAGAAGGGGA